MAKVTARFLHGTVISWCVRLCFIGVCCAIKRDNYAYEIDAAHHRLEHSVHIEVLGDDLSHNQQKRAVPSIKSTPSMTTPISTTEKTWQKPSKLPDGLKKIEILGANGTGQRWPNVTNTSVLRDQIAVIHPPITTNAPPNVSTISPEPDMPPGVMPDFPDLTPEDVNGGDDIEKQDLAKNNITNIKYDNHIFYNSTMYNDPEKGKEFWVDMSKQADVKVNDLLSNSHRRAATVKLSFEFPFYGRYIQNVTIATGGFLYTGNYVHSWLAATQYIAPLMANFDTGISNDSVVRYVDNGTSFTVEWDRVDLQDKPGSVFTFQVTLNKNGDIIFVYKNVSIPIKNIDDKFHPVKIGLSDAYILDRTVFYVRRKTIYEYHRVSFNKEEIRNWTAIYLKALPTCLDLLNCSSCLTNQLGLNCSWCPSLNQCSTGTDRNRQLWLDKNCPLRNVSSPEHCANLRYFEKFGYESTNQTLNDEVEGVSKYGDEDYMGTLASRRRDAPLGTSGCIAIIFVMLMVIGSGISWMAYAYRNPHTTSGQILIRYRPSQWRWRRGEARYTAATIHM
ncbi:plexin domain-containing protein 2 [Anthonomus grandis grandis]|uniref:plexin domain-containing protein 2 n=1 Tax=Anthonomus grandis grandis TaxID=2921223 RepID=UPI0021665DBC|nr:plexin domain-containing protein 2 [Anthonomus grandis grandis]